MRAIERVPAEVFPPGEFIREELEAREWTQEDLAMILRKPLPAINELIVGKKAITPETARGLGEAFGTGAELWMNLESSYRLALAAPCGGDVSRRAALYTAAPVKHLRKRGWVQCTDDVDDFEKSILAFYRTDSIEGIRNRDLIAARKSTSYAETSMDEWAWFCRARQMAESAPASAYSRATLRQGLADLHKLAASAEEARNASGLLADLGVRLVIVERLPKMQVDGAAFWLDDTRPAIALTLRFDRIDGFWFTLAHEIAHILHEDRPGLDVNLVGKGRQPTDEKPDSEKAADFFASDFLIAPREIEGFIARIRPLYSKTAIQQFAKRIGIHPGIVIGQLQHRREIGWGHSREMLVGVRQAVTSTAYTDGWDSLEASEEDDDE